LLSERLIVLAGEQYKWLERDLANVDRSVTPWLVATWHPPWYSSYKAHYREAECMRVEVEDLLYSYGVDIVFNGHVSYPKPNKQNYDKPFKVVLLQIMDFHSHEKEMVYTNGKGPFQFL
jgi:hypothetical protein